MATPASTPPAAGTAPPTAALTTAPTPLGGQIKKVHY